MPTARTDAELMAAFQQAGEVAAFEELVQRHHRSLINYFYHLSRDRHLAEDWAQEVFLRLVAHAKSYVPRAKFTTFLYRIARNLWIDALRQRAHHRRPASLDAPNRDGERNETWLASPAVQPSEELVSGEVAIAVRSAIDHLPEELRDVVVLGDLQGLRYAEIAEILDIPIGTVKSRMHTAVQRLKTLLASLAKEAKIGCPDPEVREPKKDDRGPGSGIQEMKPS
jgi:RNA polymerase sigma-70 factor (ECF subfamily)